MRHRRRTWLLSATNAWEYPWRIRDALEEETNAAAPRRAEREAFCGELLASAMVRLVFISERGRRDRPVNRSECRVQVDHLLRLDRVGLSLVRGGEALLGQEISGVTAKSIPAAAPSTQRYGVTRGYPSGMGCTVMPFRLPDRDGRRRPPPAPTDIPAPAPRTAAARPPAGDAPKGGSPLSYRIESPSGGGDGHRPRRSAAGVTAGAIRRAAGPAQGRAPP